MTPVNPIISGLLGALQIADTLKRQAMAQEELTLRKNREERLARMDEKQEGRADLQTKMQLSAAGAKPLDQQGRYQQNVQLPDSQIGGVTMPGASVGSTIPAAPEQTVQYGGGNYFVPTRDQLAREDFDRQVTQARQMQSVQNQGQVDLQRELLNLPIGEWDGQTITKGNAPIVQAQAGREFQARQNELNRKNQRDIADKRERGANARNSATNQARKEAAGISHDSTTRGMTEGQRRNEERLAIEKHNKMADQERQLWADRQKLGDMLKAGKTLDARGNEIQVNGALAAQMNAQIRDKERLAEELQKRQKDLRQRYGWGEFQEGAAPVTSTPAAPAASVAPENPYRRKKGA